MLTSRRADGGPVRVGGALGVGVAAREQHAELGARAAARGDAEFFRLARAELRAVGAAERGRGRGGGIGIGAAAGAFAVERAARSVERIERRAHVRDRAARRAQRLEARRVRSVRAAPFVAISLREWFGGFCV